MRFLTRIKFTFCLLLMTSSSCGTNEESEIPTSVGERNIWANDCMRPPVPVIVDAPDQFPDVKLPEGTFLVAVGAKEYTIYYQGDTLACSVISQVASIITTNGAEKLNGFVVIKGNTRSGEKQLDALVELLKEKQIFRYKLITDLEN